MTKEIVKHRKDERKKPQLTPKEKKAKKLEKKTGEGRENLEEAIQVKSLGRF